MGLSRKIISNGPALADAMAVREAIWFDRRLGHVYIVLRGDSTELIRALCTNKSSLAPHDVIFEV